MQSLEYHEDAIGKFHIHANAVIMNAKMVILCLILPSVSIISETGQEAKSEKYEW